MPRRLPVGREAAQDAGREPAREPAQAALGVHVFHRVEIPPVFWVFHLVNHDHVFHHVGRVRRDPEARRAQAAGPEVDRRCAQPGVLREPRCDQLVRPPPDNEVGAENHGRHEALVQRAEAVVSDQFDQTVDRPGELPGFCVVLDLQPRLQLFYRRSHKGHGESRSEAGQTAACKGQFFLCWVQVVLDEPAVQGERAEHDGVHEHPAHERRREALVESPNSFVAQSFQRAVDGAFEAALGGLETHFDGVERVADRVLHDAREHARDEPGVPRRVARVCGHGEK
ncbi:hypothetical protein KL939_000232 [Ogataea angusta]|nr:hypothetical protein KL939_000232 [Ogataea angusta]